MKREEVLSIEPILGRLLLFFYFLIIMKQWKLKNK